MWRICFPKVKHILSIYTFFYSKLHFRKLGPIFSKKKQETAKKLKWTDFRSSIIKKLLIKKGYFKKLLSIYFVKYLLEIKRILPAAGPIFSINLVSKSPILYTFLKKSKMILLFLLILTMVHYVLYIFVGITAVFVK